MCQEGEFWPVCHEPAPPARRPRVRSSPPTSAATGSSGIPDTIGVAVGDATVAAGVL